MANYKEYTYDLILGRLLKDEGGYVNNPNDRGGETNFGITKDTARANGYNGRMIDMKIEDAKNIYRSQYWNKVRGDDLLAINPCLADWMFNFGVNAGTGRAVKFLQRALNLLNNRQVDYADIAVDGALGNGTLRSLQAYVNKRGEEGVKNLVVALVASQIAFYLDLSEKNQTQEVFTNGWLNRAATNLRKYVKAMDN